MQGAFDIGLSYAMDQQQSGSDGHFTFAFPAGELADLTDHLIDIEWQNPFWSQEHVQGQIATEVISIGCTQSGPVTIQHCTALLHCTAVPSCTAAAWPALY